MPFRKPPLHIVNTGPADPDPTHTPSVDDAVVNGWLSRRLKAMKSNWATIAAALAFLGAMGAWGEAHMIASANAHADAGDKTLQTQISDIKNDVLEIKTNVGDIKFFIGAPSRAPVASTKPE